MKKQKKALKWICCFLLLMAGLGGEVKGATVFDSSLSVSERYNDNLFFTEVDRKGDFTTVVSPTMSLAYSSRNLSLTMRYRGSAQFHVQNSEADGYFQGLLFDLDLPILNRLIKGLEVSVTEEVLYTPGLSAFSFGQVRVGDTEARLDRVLLEGEGVQTRRINTFRSRAGISLRYPWSRRFSTTASYRNVITRFSGGVRQNRMVNNGTLDGRYRYQSSRRTEWEGAYGISLTAFDGDEDLVHRLRLGVEHQSSPLVSVSGDLGVSFVEDESARITSGARLAKRYKTGRLTLRYAFRIVTGQGVVRGVTRRQSVIGEATRTLGRRVSSYVRLGFASNRGFRINDVDTSTYTAGAGITIDLLSWLTGSVSYSYLNQQAQGSIGQDAQRNLVFISLTAIGPSWRTIQ